MLKSLEVNTLKWLNEAGERKMEKLLKLLRFCMNETMPININRRNAAPTGLVTVTMADSEKVFCNLCELKSHIIEIKIKEVTGITFSV
ncbi:MAG: hypothetical protein ACD_9C00333G0008 [uncultured bacterium]|nr:MAG: hypothetical protein ACD_9C00333G0008 [uncultured bacterium]